MSRRKSDQEKRKQGTRDVTRTFTEMEAVPMEEKPGPPVDLSGHALTVWNDTIGFLFDNEMLFQADLHLICSYCSEMGIYYDMADEMKKRGNGPVRNFTNGKQRMKIINPVYKASCMALANAVKLADKFGFNPAARARINVTPKEGSAKGDPVGDKLGK